MAVAPTGPHAGTSVLHTGAPLDTAQVAMIMIHGRGATAESILLLAGDLGAPGVAYLAPQAVGDTWYPYPFMEPIHRNEPWLSSALEVVGWVCQQVEEAGIPAERMLLLGFSQGACLTLEFTARNARRYGGVAGLSGGLIGPDGTPRDYPGSLEGTAVFLGCSDVDFHIPKERVLDTEQVLRGLGAEVTTRLYPNMGHTVNEDEIKFVRKMIDGLKRET
jgi:phospholipase/carboxylesterase